MHVNPEEIFSDYRRDMSAQEYPGVAVDRLPELLRHTPERTDAEATVMFAKLPSGHEDAIIGEQIRHFADLGRRFEWKVHSLDRPRDLKARLEAHGFVPDETEILMVYSTDRDMPFASRGVEAEIRRISSEAGVWDQVAIQERIHGRDFAWWGNSLLDQLRAAPEGMSLYGAYVPDASGRIVCAGGGRIDFPKNSRFAGIFGGSLLPEFRGRGIYSALLRARIDEARARGYRYITVDSAPMSQPILRRKGFVPIAEIHAMHRR